MAGNVVHFASAPRKTPTTRAAVFSPEQALSFLRLIRGHLLEGVFLLGMALGLRMGGATSVL